MMLNLSLINMNNEKGGELNASAQAKFGNAPAPKKRGPNVILPVNDNTENDEDIFLQQPLRRVESLLK